MNKGGKGETRSVDLARLAEDGTLDPIATVDEVERAGARAKELG